MVGALYLEPSITSVATHGKFIYILCSGTARPLARFTAPSSYLKSLKESRENAVEVEGGGEGGGGEGGGDGGGGGGREVKAEAATTIAVGGLDQESAKKTDEEEEVEEKERLEQMLRQVTGSSPTHPDTSEKYNCAAPLTSLTSHSPAAEEKDTPSPSDIAENHATTTQDPPSQVDSEVPAVLPTDSTRPHPSNTEPAPATVQRDGREGSGVQCSEIEESSPVSPVMSPVRHALVSVRQTSLEEAVETASASIPGPNQLCSHDPTATSPSPPPSSTPLYPAPAPTLPSTDIGIQSSNHSPRLMPEPISDFKKSHVPGLHLAGLRSEFGREVVADLLRPTLGKLSGLLKHHERRKEGPGGQNPSNTSPQEQNPVEAGGEGGQGGGGGGGA